MEKKYTKYYEIKIRTVNGAKLIWNYSLYAQFDNILAVQVVTILGLVSDHFKGEATSEQGFFKRSLWMVCMRWIQSQVILLIQWIGLRENLPENWQIFPWNMGISCKKFPSDVLGRLTGFEPLGQVLLYEPMGFRDMPDNHLAGNHQEWEFDHEKDRIDLAKFGIGWPRNLPGRVRRVSTKSWLRWTMSQRTLGWTISLTSLTWKKIPRWEDPKKYPCLESWPCLCPDASFFEWISCGQWVHPQKKDSLSWGTWELSCMPGVHHSITMMCT